MKNQFYLYLFLFVACTSQATKVDSDVNIIKIDENKVEAIFLSEYFERLEYVFLEENMDYFVSSVDRIRVVEEHICLLNRKTQEIFVFDFNGSFIGKVSKQGQGPEEYGQIDFFDINAVTRTIDIYDISSGFIKSYDFTGNVSSKLNARIIARDFIIDNQGNYIFYCPDEENIINGEKVSSGLIGLNRTTGAIKSIISFGDKDYKPYSTGFEMVKSPDDRILVFSNYSEDVLSIFNNQVTHEYTMRYNTPVVKEVFFRNLDPDEIMELKSPFLKLSPFYTGNLFGYSFLHEGKTKYLLYNQKTKQSMVVKDIINDMDGLFPIFTEGIVSTDGEYLINVLSENNIGQLDYYQDLNRPYMNDRKQIINPDTLKNHILKNQGNPIVIMAKFK